MNTKSPENLPAILSEIILEAGAHTLSYFRKDIHVDSKSDASPVTVADRETESLIRDRIHTYFPSHGIIGEEYEDENSEAEFTWVIDPIDGTQSFVHGIPLFTVLIAVLQEGNPIHSAIYSPATNELMTASKGKGTFLNQKRVFCRNLPLEKATILTNGMNYIHQRGIEKETNALIAHSAVHRTWCDAYGHMMVACGRADVMIDPYLMLWDSAPLSLAISQAGGRYLTLDGTHSIYADSGISVTESLAEHIKKVFHI